MQLDPHFESSEFQNGLWPNRLAYLSNGAAPSRAPGAAVEAEKKATTTLEALKKRVKEGQEALSKNHDALSKKVGAYNDNTSYVDKKYGTDDYGDIFDDNAKTKTKRRPQEQPIKLDFENLDKTIKQIENLQKADFYYNDDWIPFSQIAVSPGRVKQYADTEAILKLIKKHQALKEELRLREKEKRNGNGIRLVRKMEKVERMPELKSELEKKPAYREAMLAFQRAAENPLKDSDFERFWTLPEGETSDQQLRESRQWLFTMLAEKTNRFESGKFLLGEDFGPDPVENKKNFPFIHHEWLKYSKANEIRTKAVNVEVENLEGKYRVKRNEIPKAIDAMIAALGADGVDIKNEAAEVKASPPSEYYKQMADAVKTIRDRLFDKKEKIKKDSLDNTKRITALNENIATLEGYMGLANRAKDYHIYNEQDAAKNQAFTREGLKKNPQVLMELIMLKFQKAMNIVDMPFGKEGGSYSRIPHPGIRRELIALVYDAGVSRYRRNREGKVVYDDNITDDYKWMLGKMAGPYFNHLEKGRHLSKEQSDFILFAYYGNLSLTRQKFLEEEVLAPLQRIKALMDSEKTGREIEKAIAPLRFYIKGVRPGEKLNETTLAEVLKREKRTLKTWGDLHRKAAEIARIPEDAKTRKAIADYIKEFKKSKTPYEDIYGFNAEMIEKHHTRSEERNIVYNSLDFNARSKANYMERMGIRIEALYESYLTYQAEHPEMKVDDWTNLLLTKEGTDQLADMFESIIAETNPSVAMGKEDFLVILRTLHNPELLSTEKPALRNAHPAVISLVKALQVEVEHQEKIRNAVKKGAAEVQARLEGMTFGDTVTEYTKGVIDMVIGPGQSIANRAAGAAILFMAYKLIRKGIKMEGPLGKIIAGLGIGVAIELVLKKMTGSGLLDRAKLTGIAEAMKGTHEYVLIEKGNDLMKKNDISRSEHARALSEMNRVPFSDLMDWYEKTDASGNPLAGNKRLKLPRQISTYNIVKGMKHKDEDARAAFVVKKAMQVFFTYVNNKEGKKGHHSGFLALKERWVTAIEDPSFKLDSKKHTNLKASENALKRFRGNSRELTWEVVLRAEVTTHDVELAQKQGVVEQVVEFGKDTINKAVRVVRQKIYAPGTVTAKQTWETMGLYAPAVKKMFADLVTTGKEKFYITKNKVEIWYGANEHLVVQFVDDNWQFVKGTAVLPFKFVFAIHQAAIPWATVKIRQIEELLRSDQLVTTPNKLALSDIIGSDLLTTEGALRKNPRGRGNLIDDPDYLYSQEQNENFKFLGYYSLPFMRAFNKANGKPDRIMDGDAFEIDTHVDSDEKDHNVGFLISAVDVNEAGVVKTDGPAQRYQKMLKAARNKAKEQFISNYKGDGELTNGMLKNYMDTIHVIAQTATDKKNPKKLFVFYRMPMPDSHEFFLKELGRYSDYYDSGRLKERPPFRVNPKLSLFENLKEASGVNAYGTRKFGGYALKVLSQWLRVSAFTIEKTGSLARGIVDLVPNRWLPPSQTRWITKFTSLSEKQKQAIDEVFESGASTSTALSNFYKRSGNADNYRHALEVAIKGKVKDSRGKGMELYLGHIGGRQNRENYNKRPRNMAQFHQALQKERTLNQ